MINPCIEHSFQCELLILSLCSLRNHKNHLILNLVFTEGEDTTLPLNSVLRYSLILQLWGESLESTVITQTSPGNMTDFYHNVKRWKEEGFYTFLTWKNSASPLLSLWDHSKCFFSLTFAIESCLTFAIESCFDFCNRILLYFLQSDLVWIRGSRFGEFADCVKLFQISFTRKAICTPQGNQ